MAVFILAMKNLPLLAILAFSLVTGATAATTDPVAAAGEIDGILAKDWKANHLPAPPKATDEAFVRRIYLDVVGRIPTAREAEQFLQSTDPKKREHLIDQLLASNGYVQHYFNFWADVLRAQSGNRGVFGYAYVNYLKQSLRENKPYNKLVHELVAATGKVWDNGAIGYYTRDQGMPLDNMAITVRIFLGTRIECAQCHNHPFDKWTQRQFYEMAAYTYGIQAGNNRGPAYQGVQDILQKRDEDLRHRMQAAKGKPDAELASEMQTARDERNMINDVLGKSRNNLQQTALEFRERKLELPKDYKYPDAKPKAVVTATVMMGNPVNCPSGSNTLDAYADWMTSPDNPRFTKVIANRLWKQAFGLALIEPLDELTDASEPSNPELMTYLEKLMISDKYDMKSFLKAVFNSKAYQAQVHREEVPQGVPYHFTGPILRRMSAEQMWDSFVTLINPTPDMPNATSREQRDQRIIGTKKLSDALDSLSPEDLLQRAKSAGQVIAQQAPRLKELRKEMLEVLSQNDKEKGRELNKEMGELQNKGLRAVNDQVVVPAIMKLKADHTPKVAGDADTPAEEPPAMMLLKGDAINTISKIDIPGYQSPKSDAEVAEERTAQEKVLLEEANYYGIPEKQQKSYVQYREQQMRTWLRAAEIDSPAPRGHYLREFGQSDREFVENANHDASVPQALAMMNGNLLPEILGNFSQLTLSVNRAKYPDDQVEAIYMTLLSRKPTDKEKHAWLEAQSKGLSDPKDLIYALLNTQQFIFIQ